MKRTLSILLLLLGTTVLAAADAPPGAVPQFPGIESIPLPKAMGYGGFFKDHQPAKVVFGVSDPTGQLKESLTNASLIIRYLKHKGYRYEIQFVLYGKAVFAADMWNQRYSGYGDLMKALHKQGVEFRVCYNSMHSLGVKKDDVFPYMKVIPAGILQLIKKQMQGYAYISNR